jgi:hypothetical protein
MTISDLDNLFAYLYSKGANYVRYLDIVSEHFKNDEKTYDVQGMLIKLDKDGYVDTGTFSIQNNEGLGVKQQTIYKLSFEGRLLFENSSHNKPYLGLKRRAKQRQIWDIAKIVITALNAMAILYLMWKQVPSH